MDTTIDNIPSIYNRTARACANSDDLLDVVCGLPARYTGGHGILVRSFIKCALRA